MKKNLPITHLFITHAHADHFGGAQYIQRNFNVHTIAPSLEEAIMRNSILEPIYLFNGNSPLSEMRNKFLEAPSIRVDEICTEGIWDKTFPLEFLALPGHSHNQFGVSYKGILYAADAFLGSDVLEKHKIPFIVNATENQETLLKLKNMNIEGMVPGHGKFTKKYHEVIQENIDVHEKIATQVHSIIAESGDSGISLENLIAKIITQYNIQPANIGMYTLLEQLFPPISYSLLKKEKRCIKYGEENQLFFGSVKGINNSFPSDFSA